MANIKVSVQLKPLQLVHYKLPQWEVIDSSKQHFSKIYQNSWVRIASLMTASCSMEGEVTLHAQTDGSMLTMHRQSYINCVLAEGLAQVQTKDCSLCKFSLSQMVSRRRVEDGSVWKTTVVLTDGDRKVLQWLWSIGLQLLIFASQVSKYLYIWETYSMTLCQSGLSVFISSSMSCL